MCLTPSSRRRRTLLPCNCSALSRSCALAHDVQFPPLRSKSRLLPLAPASAVFYVSLPNYGGVLRQGQRILQQELESNEAFRSQWKGKVMSGSPDQFDEFLHDAIEVADYLGDEMVVTTSFHEGKDSTILIAEVRKPGLAAVLHPLIQRYSGQSGSSKSESSIRILTPEQLAPGAIFKESILVLVRSDFVVVAQNPGELREFNARLNEKGGAAAFLEGTPFGQRILQAYQAGVGVLAAADVMAWRAQSPQAQKTLSMLKQTGFDDVKYAVADRRETSDQGGSTIDLNFAGARHGLASWIGMPGAAGGLDFIAPDTAMAVDLHLKDLSQVLEDLQDFIDPTNRSFTAGLDMAQKQFNIDIRADLLGKLTGEIAVAYDPPSGGDSTPAIRAILGVRDADVLQQTLKGVFTLLGAMTPDATDAAIQQSTEGGVIYYSVRPPGLPNGGRLHYAFVENYMVLGMSRATVREAVGFHKNGRSLAHSADLQSALPRENGGGTSIVLFQDYSRLLDLTPMPSERNQFLKALTMGKKNIVWTVAGEDSIRIASSEGGPDMSTMILIAAQAFPEVLASEINGNASAAAQGVRVLAHDEITYAATYPARGYAPSLAVLGGGPACPATPSARHACLLEAPLGNAKCVAGAWCEREGYLFSLAGVRCTSGNCKDFVAMATPKTTKSGNRNFCATSDGEVRFQSAPPLTKFISVDECRKWTSL
jgi:hypothetical protein